MTDTVTLYELAEMRGVLDAWLDEAGGEWTPEIEALMNELDGKVHDKIERVALFVREQIATADAITQEADRLTARARVKLKAADSLKGYLKAQLERMGVTKVNGLLATVAIQRNSQPAIQTVLQAPELYALLGEGNPYVTPTVVTQYHIDRETILADWKAGTALPDGIHVTHGTHIRIR